MSTEENKALTRRWLEEGWQAEDTDAAVEEFFAPNFVLQSPPVSVKSSDEYKQLVAAVKAGFPDIRFTLEDAIVEGDRVAYHWKAHGTHQGEYMGIAPTDKQIAINGTGIFRIAGGKFVESKENHDALGLLQQVGAIPPMG